MAQALSGTASRMKIHEYQAKQLLREYGLPVSDGRVVLKADEAKTAAGEIDGPIWVVKAQIHAGGRGKGKFKELPPDAKGGVRVAFSADEAVKYAKEMIGKTLVTKQTGPAGKQVNRLYIEDGSDIAKEFYLSMLVDRSTSRIAFVVERLIDGPGADVLPAACAGGCGRRRVALRGCSRER